METVRMSLCLLDSVSIMFRLFSKLIIKSRLGRINQSINLWKRLLASPNMSVQGSSNIYLRLKARNLRVYQAREEQGFQMLEGVFNNFQSNQIPKVKEGKKQLIFKLIIYVTIEI